ncbi:MULTISPECIES: hypothetical protein [Haloferax]|uniref:Uncharacterized protein n=1 Tax=Haloferax massiliensis TaxID=1476858 RepID=A0A0D6JXL7_9EURY|nr:MULTISPECIES: hypothetical protein [Haloferax]MDS0240991.1 hypothetical protein [Haloferax sp. S2CR25]MDS0444112.1 hypothetical protein [Haloferax sp. S2CR25-2]CQR53919.1 hypothetical protein BN996_03866 [Haloferax massiliensis]
MRVPSPSRTARAAASGRSGAVESAVVAALLLGVALLQFAVRESLAGVAPDLLRSRGFVVAGVVTGGTLVCALALYAGAYARVRDIALGVRLPAVADRGIGVVAVAAAAPALLVAATKVVGLRSGVTYGSLTKTGYGADATLAAVAPVSALAALVGVPVLVVVSQVLVQRSFARALDGRRALAVTTATASLAFLSANRGVVVFPALEHLVRAAVFLACLGVAFAAATRATTGGRRALGYAPLAVVSTVAVGEELLAVDSLAGGVFVLSHVAVFALAAVAYDRTVSLVVPALAYLSLLVSGDAVVFLFEAGL